MTMLVGNNNVGGGWQCLCEWLGRGAVGCLGVAEEGFEAVVHVGLDVAVEEGEAGLVGGEVYGGAAVEGDDYGVLDDAGGGGSVVIDQLELVAVQVEGVGVVGEVAEDEAVA